MTARQFPKTLMWGAMWSEQLCLYEFFKTWTPVGFSNHEFLTLRRFIWRLVKLETKIKCAKCSPDNCLQPCFWLNHFDQFFDEIWSFEWSPLMSQNRRWRKDSRTPCIYRCPTDSEGQLATWCVKTVIVVRIKIIGALWMKFVATFVIISFQKFENIFFIHDSFISRSIMMWVS